MLFILEDWTHGDQGLEMECSVWNKNGTRRHDQRSLRCHTNGDGRSNAYHSLGHTVSYGQAHLCQLSSLRTKQGPEAHTKPMGRISLWVLFYE